MITEIPPKIRHLEPSTGATRVALAFERLLCYRLSITVSLTLTLGRAIRGERVGSPVVNRNGAPGMCSSVS